MRQAMSMIELVFAIVIMGIAVMSLPLILTQVQNNNAFAMQQEAILAAKAKIGQISTYEWDDKSFDTNGSFVLDVTGGSGDLNRTNGQLRKGHVNAEGRRKFFPNTTNATAVATSSANDIDRFNGIPTSIVASAEVAGKGLDYVFTLTLTPTITYANDTPTATYSNTPLNTFTFNPANTGTITNIKTISVLVSGADRNITLRTFLCNIGESSMLPSRPYQ